jgi:hypothetical protein
MNKSAITTYPYSSYHEQIYALAHVTFESEIATLAWDNNSRNHNKAHHAFLHAASNGITEADAMKAVIACIRAVGGIPDHRDLAEQWFRACTYVGKARTAEIKNLPKEPRLSFSPDALRHIGSRVNVPDPAGFLRRTSPVTPSSVTPTKFLDTIYRPSEKIIVFKNMMTQGQAIYTVGQSSPTSIPTTGQEGIWFLVQPVDGEYHFDSGPGKRSRRSISAITRLPYLVLESDKADLADWVRLLIQLPLVIVAIYTSGGRSIHALVRVDAADKAEWDEMKRKIAKVMVPLGADPGALSAVRLSRLPGCLRGGELQELLYLNPDADGTPIYCTTQP